MLSMYIPSSFSQISSPAPLRSPSSFFWPILTSPIVFNASPILIKCWVLNLSACFLYSRISSYIFFNLKSFFNYCFVNPSNKISSFVLGESTSNSRNLELVFTSHFNFSQRMSSRSLTESHSSGLNLSPFVKINQSKSIFRTSFSSKLLLDKLLHLFF